MMHQGRPVAIVSHQVIDDRLHVRIQPVDAGAGERDGWLIDTGLSASASGIIGEGLTAAQIEAAVMAALT